MEKPCGALAVGLSQELLDALATVEETSGAEEGCDCIGQEGKTSVGSVLYRARRKRAFSSPPNDRLSCSAPDAVPQSTLDSLAIIDGDARMHESEPPSQLKEIPRSELDVEAKTA